MDIDQMKNRIEWLDEERRKDKATISDLQKKIKKIEGLQNKANTQSKESNSELTRLGVMVSKIDKFEDLLTKNNFENKKALEAQDTRHKRREKERKKAHNSELQTQNRTIAEIQNNIKSLDKIRDEINSRKENEVRFTKFFSETEEMVKKFKDGEADRNQTVKSIETERLKDSKKLADIQAEVSAIRRRTDEQRVKIELTEDSHKKIENRLAESMLTENERLENQRKFLEKVRLDQTEKDKIWKEWKMRFDKFEDQTKQLDNFLRDYTDSELAVRRAKEEFNKITEQISRRIHEITEIQRLGEERFRQEWAGFKADDQKRWANYTLTEEERFRESNREIENMAEQTTNLEDNFQELQDIVQHLKEQSDIRLKTLLAAFRDWISEEERFASSF